MIESSPYVTDEYSSFISRALCDVQSGHLGLRAIFFSLNYLGDSNHTSDPFCIQSTRWSLHSHPTFKVASTAKCPHSLEIFFSYSCSSQAPTSLILTSAFDLCYPSPHFQSKSLHFPCIFLILSTLNGLPCSLAMTPILVSFPRYRLDQFPPRNLGNKFTRI